MSATAEKDSERERNVRELGQSLLFAVEKRNGRYDLARTADVSRPVREQGLTLDEAEALLNTWKLRGAHGG